MSASVASQKPSAWRIPVALLLALPASVLSGVLLGLLAGGGESGSAVTGLAMPLSLVVFPVLFVRGAGSVRATVRRGMLAVGLQAFLLPLASLVGVAIAGSRLVAQYTTEAEQAGAAVGVGLGGTIALGLAIVLAFVLGVPALILWFVLRQ